MRFQPVGSRFLHLASCLAVTSVAMLAVVAETISPVPITKDTKSVQTYGVSSTGVEIVAYATSPGLPGSNPPLYGLASLVDQEIVPLKLLPQSPFRREYNGGSWFEMPFRWIENRRFLVFEGDNGLCLVDASTQTVLLNQALTGLTKSPTADAWAAIRYRPTGRQQDLLTGNEKDTLWFIEPTALATASHEASEDDPFKHVPSVALGGIALAPPIWSKDGTQLAIVTHSGGRIEAAVFDSGTHRRLAVAPLPDLSFTKAQLLSPWFLPAVVEPIRKAVLESGVLGQGRGSGNPPGGKDPQHRQDITPADPAESGKKEHDGRHPMVPWLAAVAAFVAVAIVLWRLLGKNRRESR